jgi:excisionase family DNA binding protein
MFAPQRNLKSSPRSVVQNKTWITVKDAAEHLGVGVDTIYLACASRGLKHVKIGHSTIRLRLEWVDAWAETLTRS